MPPVPHCRFHSAQQWPLAPAAPAPHIWAGPLLVVPCLITVQFLLTSTYHQTLKCRRRMPWSQFTSSFKNIHLSDSLLGRRAEAFLPRFFCTIASFRPIPKSVPMPHLMAPPEFVPVDIPTSTGGNPGYSERSFTSWKNRDVALIVRQVYAS